jgi:hypothetical protein
VFLDLVAVLVVVFWLHEIISKRTEIVEDLFLGWKIQLSDALHSWYFISGTGPTVAVVGIEIRGDRGRVKNARLKAM